MEHLENAKDAIKDYERACESHKPAPKAKQKVQASQGVKKRGRPRKKGQQEPQRQHCAEAQLLLIAYHHTCESRLPYLLTHEAQDRHPALRPQPQAPRSGGAGGGGQQRKSAPRGSSDRT